VDDSLVRTEQPGGGNASNSSMTGEIRSQPGVGENSAVEEDDTSPQEEEPDEIDNTTFLEALERKQTRKEGEYVGGKNNRQVGS
jgi:hypothetical protein